MMSDNSKYSWKQLINAEAFGILRPVSDAILKKLHASNRMQCTDALKPLKLQHFKNNNNGIL